MNIQVDYKNKTLTFPLEEDPVLDEEDALYLNEGMP